MSVSSSSIVLDTLCPGPEAAFNMSDFLTSSTTSESNEFVMSSSTSDSMSFAVSEWPACRQTRAANKHNQARGISDNELDFYGRRDSTVKLDEDDSPPSGPKKARRQAQNRAAQRAFRERKEKYIQELEEKVVDMTKEISVLKKDRGRLEGLLNVARAEVQTLKSMPQSLIPRGPVGTACHEIACSVDGGQAIVLAIEVNIRGVSTCQVKGNGKSQSETSRLSNSNDLG